MSIIRDPIEAQLDSFGRRLRELRQARNWSLQELAGRSALSKTFLSRLETGDRQASIAAVLTLARVFGVSLASMFESDLAVEPCVIIRAAETVPKTANGLTYTALSNAENFFNVQPLRLVISPQRRGQTHYQHEGEEWLYVLSGRLRLSLADKTYDLEPGDAAHFDSRLPHRLIARGPGEAEVLLVATPITAAGRAPVPVFAARRAIPTPLSVRPLRKLSKVND
jgi:transcriptional regulator with XRE-family HTH domain